MQVLCPGVMEYESHMPSVQWTVGTIFVFIASAIHWSVGLISLPYLTVLFEQPVFFFPLTDRWYNN